MKNHYFGVDVNVFRFGQLPDTVNGPQKVNSGDKAKESQDVKAHDFIFLVIMDLPKVC
jgi:hypothetical protein